MWYLMLKLPQATETYWNGIIQGQFCGRRSSMYGKGRRGIGRVGCAFKVSSAFFVEGESVG
jgi:hypothetical protein